MKSRTKLFLFRKKCHQLQKCLEQEQAQTEKYATEIGVQVYFLDMKLLLQPREVSASEPTKFSPLNEYICDLYI